MSHSLFHSGDRSPLLPIFYLSPPLYSEVSTTSCPSIKCQIYSIKVKFENVNFPIKNNFTPPPPFMSLRACVPLCLRSSVCIISPSCLCECPFVRMSLTVCPFVRMSLTVCPSVYMSSPCVCPYVRVSLSVYVLIACVFLLRVSLHVCVLSVCNYVSLSVSYVHTVKVLQVLICHALPCVYSWNISFICMRCPFHAYYLWAHKNLTCNYS